MRKVHRVLVFASSIWIGIYATYLIAQHFSHNPTSATSRFEDNFLHRKEVGTVLVSASGDDIADNIEIELTEAVDRVSYSRKSCSCIKTSFEIFDRQTDRTRVLNVSIAGHVSPIRSRQSFHAYINTHLHDGDIEEHQFTLDVDAVPSLSSSSSSIDFGRIDYNSKITKRLIVETIVGSSSEHCELMFPDEYSACLSRLAVSSHTIPLQGLKNVLLKTTSYEIALDTSRVRNQEYGKIVHTSANLSHPNDTDSKRILLSWEHPPKVSLIPPKLILKKSDSGAKLLGEVNVQHYYGKLLDIFVPPGFDMDIPISAYTPTNAAKNEFDLKIISNNWSSERINQLEMQNVEIFFESYAEGIKIPIVVEIE